MILFNTLTADARVLSTHQTLDEARAFAAEWNGSDAPQPKLRPAARIVSSKRATYDAATRRLVGSAVYARSDRFNLAMAIEHFAL